MFEKVSAALAEYPHILKNITIFWPDKKMLVEYLEILLRDTRDHSRQGFPAHITLVLMEVHTHYAPPPDFIHRDFTLL